jgi:serine/threonine-protein kinase
MDPHLLALLSATPLLFALLACACARNPRAEPASVRLGPYLLQECIGEGGMGIVYKARHALSGSPTAIKLLHPHRRSDADVQRLQREAELTSRLTHPNTVSVYGFGQSEAGAPYYAMEYVDGIDLQTLVERDGPQPAARVAHVLAQLCAALGEAHDAGLLHRDVKPANVMLCERGGQPDLIKVLDFGLASRFGELRDEPAGEQTVLGTPHYLAPEVLTRPETMDGRTDLYAVGAVGYFLLTGVPPFAGRSLVEVCAQHLHTAPVAPSRRLGSAVPERLERLILSCLEKSKHARPASAASLRDELLSLAGSATFERVAKPRNARNERRDELAVSGVCRLESSSAPRAA